MKGFEISYREPSGSLSSTFMGYPISSGSVPDPLAIVLLAFQRSHPGSVILAVRPCNLTEFERKFRTS